MNLNSKHELGIFYRDGTANPSTYQKGVTKPTKVTRGTSVRSVTSVTSLGYHQRYGRRRFQGCKSRVMKWSQSDRAVFVWVCYIVL